MTSQYNEAIENLSLNAEKSIQVLINGLGDPSSEIRDDLVYKELEIFIKSKKNTAKINLFLFNELIGKDYLAHEGKEINQVLLRSFSALLLSNVIFQDSQVFKKLSSSDLTKAFHLIKEYLIKEVNLEEKNKDYGWVHCFAHGGDVLTTLMIHGNTDKILAKEISKFILDFESSTKFLFLGTDSKKRLSAGIDIGKALKKIQ